MIIIDP